VSRLVRGRRLRFRRLVGLRLAFESWVSPPPPVVVAVAPPVARQQHPVVNRRFADGDRARRAKQEKHRGL